ncbi:MAG: hypothetical protein IGR92_02045 [Leptolyngbyaceae cyanobacterium T60_A2020_046]|nr:hypothetical protein [Leptolyngbyaceae cyanobacterium T60_A2020_046]
MYPPRRVSPSIAIAGRGISTVETIAPLDRKSQAAPWFSLEALGKIDAIAPQICNFEHPTSGMSMT